MDTQLSPCIRCTPKMWEYIEPILIDLGFRIVRTNESATDWKCYPYLVINFCGVKEQASFVSSSIPRDLFTDVEEFLGASAAYIGKTYAQKIPVNRFTLKDLEPGMIVEFKNKDMRLVLKSREELLFIDDSSFTRSNLYTNNLVNLRDTQCNIDAVYIPVATYVTSHLFDKRRLAKIWQRTKISITHEEVAKLLNVDPSELFIEMSNNDKISES